MGRRSHIVGFNTYSVQQPRHAERERKVPAKIADPGEDTRACLNDRLATSITARLNYETPLCHRAQLCSLAASLRSASTMAFTALRHSIDFLAPRPVALPTPAELTVASAVACLHRHLLRPVLAKDLAGGTRGAVLTSTLSQ